MVVGSKNFNLESLINYLQNKKPKRLALGRGEKFVYVLFEVIYNGRNGHNYRKNAVVACVKYQASGKSQSTYDNICGSHLSSLNFVCGVSLDLSRA